MILLVNLPSNRRICALHRCVAEAKKRYALLKDSADAIIAITQQTIAEDMRLAKKSGIGAILGGHEPITIRKKWQCVYYKGAFQCGVGIVVKGGAETQNAEIKLHRTNVETKRLQ